MDLILATHNEGKRRELIAMLGRSFNIIHATFPEVEEDGETYIENAQKKAIGTYKATGILSLADDSGLEIHLLKGEPGLYSARYAGDGATWEANRALVSSEIRRTSRTHAPGSYLCTLVLAGLPDAARHTYLLDGVNCMDFYGVCHGEWTFEPHGDNGFGYDPHFKLADGRYMAELSMDEKNKISHRGMAVDGLLRWLYHWM